MSCSSVSVSLKVRSEEDIVNFEEIDEEDIIIDVETASDDDDIYVNSEYVEGDLDYLDQLQRNEEEEELNIVAVESIDENLHQSTDESSDSNDIVEKSSENELQSRDHSQEINIDESAVATEATNRMMKCFLCLRSAQKTITEWKRCSDASCQTFICRRCSARDRAMKSGSLCICCGRKYIKGPTRKYKICNKCRYWQCPACNVECRCVLRSRASHHNFF